MSDIARLAGVSKATVSRALNDSSLVNADTRERVQAIARKHGFYINATARSLSRRQSSVVALATLPYELVGSGDPRADGVLHADTLPDAFMLELISGLTSGLHARGYDLLMVQIDPRDTGWIGRYLDSGRVDGFVVMAAQCTARHLRALEARRAQFVVWGRRSDSRSHGTVTGDSFAGGRIATAHLLACGRRRIALIGGPRGEDEAGARFDGYAAALQEAGLRLDPSLITYGPYSPESGAERTRRLLARRDDIDAIFACSDLMAVAAIEELRAQGRRVPGDVAVVGYDDISLAAHTDPPLTTVRQPGPLAGQLLADCLIQQLRTGIAAHAEIPAELVIRASA